MQRRTKAGLESPSNSESLASSRFCSVCEAIELDVIKAKIGLWVSTYLCEGEERKSTASHR